MSVSRGLSSMLITKARSYSQLDDTKFFDFGDVKSENDAADCAFNAELVGESAENNSLPLDQFLMSFPIAHDEVSNEEKSDNVTSLFNGPGYDEFEQHHVLNLEDPKAQEEVAKEEESENVTSLFNGPGYDEFEQHHFLNLEDPNYGTLWVSNSQMMHLELDIENFQVKTDYPASHFETLSNTTWDEDERSSKDYFVNKNQKQRKSRKRNVIGYFTDGEQNVFTCLLRVHTGPLGIKAFAKPQFLRFQGRRDGFYRRL